ncbi:MAG: hypothetical protein ABR577_05135 [Pyrinomonadaceae bacterium]
MSILTSINVVRRKFLRKGALTICALMTLAAMSASAAFAQTTTPIKESRSDDAIKAPETKCTLTLAQVPAVRGFRLGMTTKDFKTRFPTVEIASADITGRSLAAIYTKDSQLKIDRSNLKDVESVLLSFADDRLETMSVTYDSATRWESTDQFVAVISQSLALPGTWKAVNWWQESLDCDGFRATVGANVKNYIKLEALVDKQSREEILSALAAERRLSMKQKEEKQRQEAAKRRAAFKP